MAKICDSCGSEKESWGAKGKYGMNLCYICRHQMDTYGKLLGRSKFDPNTSIVYGDTTILHLRDTKQEVIATTTIDTSVYDKVAKYIWCIDGRGYVIGRVEGKLVKLHRLIMDAEKGKVIDHINRDKLDNRLCNLRQCTDRDNSRNASISKNNTSGYTGVRRTKSGKWKAEIMVNRKNKSLGTHVDINDALEARRVATVKYFGEFAAL